MTRNTHATMIDELTIADLADMRASTLAALAEEVSQQAALLASRKSKLEAAMERRFGDAMRSALAAKQSDTGTIHLTEDEQDITVTIGKTVDWNQDELRKAMATIEAWGEDPREYLSLKLSVAESAYKAWPDSIRKVFEPARTMKPGKPKFTFKASQSEAA